MKEVAKSTVAKPILTQLKEMKVGDVLVFPAEKRSSIKTMCSEYGFEWNKIFSTATNRHERTVSVTRKA